jgi:hypothetical protein
MAELLTTRVIGKVSATLAASEAADYTRLQEVQAALGEKAELAHSHTANQISDLAASLPLLLAGAFQTETVWMDANLGLNVRLQAGGGVVAGPEGLALDPSGVSRPGHQHRASDVTDLAEGLTLLLAESLQETETVWIDASLGLNVRLQAGGGLVAGAQGLALDNTAVSRPGHQHALGDVAGLAGSLATSLSELLLNSPTVEWARGDAGCSGVVRCKVNGAILSDDNGLFVDLGSGAYQAAPGNHSHDQLHDALSLADSDSLTLQLTGQQLSAEILLAESSGLLAQSGLAVDFGTGPTQVAPGDHTHAELDGLADLQAALTALMANGNVNLAAGNGLVINGVQVVGAQQAAIQDAVPLSGVATFGGYAFASAAQFNAFLSQLNFAIGQLNQGIAVMRSHGLVAE